MSTTRTLRVVRPTNDLAGVVRFYREGLGLGGTGKVGSAVSGALRAHGARVCILCRSEPSAQRAEALGCTPVPGDIAAPGGWVAGVPSFDVVVHAAATFDDHMAPRTRALPTTRRRNGPG